MVWTGIKKFGLGLVLGGVLALAGCGTSTSTSADGSNKPSSTAGEGGTSDAKKKIAMIPKGATHEFWKSVHEGAEKAAAEFNIELIWKGPLQENDREQQIKIVEDFTSAKVDGILLAPLDDTALRIPVSAAIKEGIPVAIFDSGLKDIETVSFVATDNYKAGQLAGQKMVELLGGKGKVILLRYEEGSASTHEREEGFLAAVKTAPGIEILSDNQYAGATVESAQTAAENLISRFGGASGFQAQGLFTPNESATFGTLRALQDAGIAGKGLKFVGFDSSEFLLKGIRSGELDAVVIQNPRKMGYEAVKAMAMHLKGEKVELRIDTGANVVTKENIDADEMKELLAPPKG